MPSPQTGKKVVIAVPCGEMVHAAFAASLANMLMYTTSCIEETSLLNCTVQFYGSSILPHSRQTLAQYALELDGGRGFTHILWLDSDMEFPPQLLVRLMEHDDKVVGINAMARRPPYRTTAQRGDGIKIEWVQTKPESTGLEPVNRTGMAVFWHPVEALRKIAKPWFDFVY